MIQKYYEISCDHCGQADYFMGSKKSAEFQYRNDSVKGIVTADKKHFCDKECHENYKKNNLPEL